MSTNIGSSRPVYSTLRHYPYFYFYRYRITCPTENLINEFRFHFRFKNSTEPVQVILGTVLSRLKESDMMWRFENHIFTGEGGGILCSYYIEN